MREDLAHSIRDYLSEIEWAHIDVAGPSWNNGGPRGYTPKRATGVPVRTVVATLREIASK